MPDWPKLAEAVSEIERLRDCGVEEALEELFADLIMGRRKGAGVLDHPGEERRGAMRSYSVSGGHLVMTPIPIDFWLAVKHGTGSSVDYTNSRGWEAGPGSRGQYVEIQISPRHGSERVLQEQNAGKGGRYDWDDFWVEVVRIAALDGLPHQDQLEQRMMDFCLKRWGNRMEVEDTICDKLKRVYDAVM